MGGALTTWFGSTPLTTWLDDLHRDLHLGSVGRFSSEIAASWLWVVRRTRSRHASTGLWLAIGLLFVSLTGLTWSRFAGANFSTLLTAADAGRPELDATLTSAGGSPWRATRTTTAPRPRPAPTCPRASPSTRSSAPRARRA